MKVVDISSNNGSVDFEKLAADGVTAVMIRATLGYGTSDNHLAANAAAASAAGLDIGYYHVCYADRKQGGTTDSDATAEAKWFLQCIAALPAAKWLIADCETPTQLSRDEYQAWLKMWASIVDTTSGLQPVIYTYKSYMDAHLPGVHIFGGSPLWIANYDDVDTPPLPVGWNKYWLWQYTQSGAVNGVEGHVDISREWGDS